MKQVELDIKRTINYLAGEDGHLYNIETGFKKARTSSLISASRLMLAIWTLINAAELTDDGLNVIKNAKTTGTPLLNALFKSIRADVIGPNSRLGSKRIAYRYGKDPIESTSLVSKIKNFFSADTEDNGLFTTIDVALKKKIRAEKAWRKTISSNPRYQAEYTLSDVDKEIFSLNEARKLCHHAKLGTQAFVHTVSAIRLLDLVGFEIESSVKDSDIKTAINIKIEALLLLYQKYETVDYSFQDKTGLQINKENFSHSEVLHTRGKELGSLLKSLYHLIDNLEASHFIDSNLNIIHKGKKCNLGVDEYKHYLKGKLWQSQAYYNIKSEVLEQLATYDSRLSRAISRLLAGGTWAGLIGCGGMIVGSILTFTPLMPLGQGMFYASTAMTALGLASATYLAARGVIYTPLKYGATPQLGEFMLSIALVTGLSFAGGLKLLAAHQILGEFALGMLSGISGVAKLPLQTGGFIKRQRELQQEHSEDSLRKDCFSTENLSTEKILHFLNSALQSKPSELQMLLRSINASRQPELPALNEEISIAQYISCEQQGYSSGEQVEVLVDGIESCLENSTIVVLENRHPLGIARLVSSSMPLLSSLEEPLVSSDELDIEPTVSSLN